MVRLTRFNSSEKARQHEERVAERSKKLRAKRTARWQAEHDFDQALLEYLRKKNAGEDPGENPWISKYPELKEARKLLK
jgi:hypothetical protein